MINKQTAKYIQSLQDKKFRDLHGSFVAEGPKLVNELLAAGNFECENIYCTENGTKSLPANLAKKITDTINIAEEFELDKITGFATANKIIGIFKKRTIPENPDLRKRLTIVLDDIQDPGNLGTIIRIADWFGIENIFCSLVTADCYNPKVVQSTMASLGRVNMVYGNLSALMEQHPSIKKYAAVLNGEDVTGIGKIKEAFIIIGNESKGVSEELLKQADQRISIAKKGNAESLNAAVATGIILFALV